MARIKTSSAASATDAVLSSLDASPSTPSATLSTPSASRSHSLPTSATPSPAADTFTKEVRFAVVMYGGVSLAVYINGVTQELLRMVRASAPKEGNPMTFEFRREAKDLSGTERVYREMAAKLESRFVVDILSGTSAGGINALYLAKALVGDRSLDELKQLWVEEGDIAKLLNDADSLEGNLPADLLERPPRSLLNGQRFYWKLLDALEGMDESKRHVDPAERREDAPSPYLDEIDLFITATDFDGVKRALPLDDLMVLEPVHRHVFHFRYQKDDQDPTKPTEKHDLRREMNPMLAFAARCTASFPGAFAPVKLEDIDPVLRSHERYADAPDKFLSSAPEWGPFFAGGADDKVPGDYARRYFVDGGYLDNKPFELAIDALGRRRRPLLEIERKLIYIEPDPEIYKNDSGRTKPETDEETARPDLLAAVVAVDSLPRVETIRKELEQVNRRNRLINRAWVLTAGLEEDVLLQKQGHQQAQRSQSKDGHLWAMEDLTDLVVERGVAYGGYHRLKISRLTDWLAGIVQLFARKADDKRFSYEEARRTVAAWRDAAFKRIYTKEQRNQWILFKDARAAVENARTNKQKDLVAAFEAAAKGRDPHLAVGLPATENRLLMDYDVAYRTRRLEFVRLKLRELVKSYDCAKKLTSDINKADPGKDHWTRDRRDMIALQGTLQPLHMRLLGLEEKVRRSVNASQTKPAAILAAVRDALFDQLREIGDLTRAAFTPGASAPQGPWFQTACGILKHFYDSYDDFDLVRFPALHSLDTEDLDEVKVIRISAADTTLAGRQGVAKLAGAKAGHFGAFFDGAWRRNDILWGRLDGAERMITTLARDCDSKLRDRWLIEAFIAIIQEELSEKIPVAESAEALAETLIAVFERPAADGTRAPAAVTDARRGELIAAAKSALATARGAWDKVVAGTVAGVGLEDRKKDIAAFLMQAVRNEPLEAKHKLELAARTTAVLRKVLSGVADGRGHAGNPVFKWGFNLLSVIWGLVELATPKSVGQAILRYWLQIIALAGGLLFAAGWLFELPGGIRVGGVAVALAIVAGLLGRGIGAVAFDRRKRSPVVFASILTVLAAGGFWIVLPHVRGIPAGSSYTMMDFELAASPERAARVLVGWKQPSPTVVKRTLVTDAAQALHWDFAFIFTYMGLGVGISFLVGAFLRRFTAIRGDRVGWALSGASVVAGLCDVAENFLLLWLLGVGPDRLAAPLHWYQRESLAPMLAFGLASLKFGLLFVVLMANAGGALIAAALLRGMGALRGAAVSRASALRKRFGRPKVRYPAHDEARPALIGGGE